MNMGIGISLCMIVKDEAVSLQRCLNAVKDVVDEIIVVDTGSIDDTTEIARLHGAVVICTEWNGDFSEARNLSLAAATKPWILGTSSQPSSWRIAFAGNAASRSPVNVIHTLQISSGWISLRSTMSVQELQLLYVWLQRFDQDT